MSLKIDDVVELFDMILVMTSLETRSIHDSSRDVEFEFAVESHCRQYLHIDLRWQSLTIQTF